MYTIECRACVLRVYCCFSSVSLDGTAYANVLHVGQLQAKRKILAYMRRGNLKNYIENI